MALTRGVLPLLAGSEPLNVGALLQQILDLIQLAEGGGKV